MGQLRVFFSGFDLTLFLSVLGLTCMGLVTMYSHVGDNAFFDRQLLWIGLAVLVMFLAMIPDYRFLRTGNIAFFLYVATVAMLLLVLVIGEITLGAQSRFDFGFFSLQPSDPAKLILIIVLAKYFAKRHELIGDFRHIIVSGIYAIGVFGLVFIQPDFGSAIILFFVWLGMVLVSGIKLRHLLTVFTLGSVVLGLMWQFVFFDYQKERIMTFLDPLSDIQGAGYNAYQSTVAIGSGELFGKGIGYGTQSKLLFLPEYETDFIFAAFAEEWGLLGVILLFILFALVVWRLLRSAVRGAANFERLFAAGVCILFVAHFFVHIGMNIGLLPVTGTTIPFLSYGGSHLMTEFLAVGMVMGMRRYATAKYQPRELLTE
ncbi:MAG: rod shape-determining protein RodA [Candidatus Kaiserbacteria bacterium]|nr:rod shape-determining protein RodA [Candidatus Kaiserbacteria bacterium]MCB9816342.1 rod shape-determining protein RodA [Candidatus Nomurabacteria bacterium]